MIYAIKAEGTEYVKFGFTGGVGLADRLGTLQTGCPHALVVLATVEWPDYIEQKIHHRLRKLHVRGEWFTLGPEAIRVVEIMRHGLLWEIQEFIGQSSVAPQHRLSKALSFAARVQNEPEFLTSKLGRRLSGIDNIDESGIDK